MPENRPLSEPRPPVDDSSTTLAPPASPGIPPLHTTPTRTQAGWVPIGLIVVGVVLSVFSCLVLLAVGWWILRDGNNGKEAANNTPETPPTATMLVVGDAQVIPTTPGPPTATQTMPPTAPLTSTQTGPTLTYTFAPPTPIPPTATFTPSNTPPPTNTLLPTETLPPTNTLAPTSTLISGLALTTTPTPAAAQIQATSTVPFPTQLTNAYPAGRRVRLFYDAYSFYLWNPAGDPIAVEPLAFEAIDASGLSTGNRFEGSRWAQFYRYVEGGLCAAIETTAAPGWLRPAQCRGYNAIVTPQPTSRLVFWITRQGVTQFHVLWNEQEMARCEIAAGQCDVFLP